MNPKTWILSMILGAGFGCAMHIVWPNIPELGVLGAALIIVLLSVRISDMLGSR